MKAPKTSPLPHAGFWAALLGIAAMGWVLYTETLELQRSSARVEHSHEVLENINAVDEQMSRAESTHRGYLITQNYSLLAERDQALREVMTPVLRFTILLMDNEAQRSRAALLQPLVEKRSARMKGDPLLAAPASAESIGEGARTSSEIHRITDEMRQEERRLLDLRRSDERRVHERIGWMLVASAALALLIIVPSFLAFVAEGRARRRIEGMLREMAGSIPGALYRCRSFADGTTRFEYLSPNITPLTGIDRAAALRDPALLWSMVVEADRGHLAAAYASARQRLSPMQHDFRIGTADGDLKWIRSSAAPTDAGRGTVIWNGHWADITAQKHLEGDLHTAKDSADAANRAKSTFLAVMSHEIRTPMNGVLGMLELLSLTELDADQRRTVGVIRESGRSLQRIIDDILDFSKIEAGKLEISPEPASVRQVVETTCNMYSGNASSKGLVLTCDLADDLSPALVVDPLRLGQILNNMVSNAIKFTNEGEVEIKVRVENRQDGIETLRFEVSDTGIGMSPEAQTRLFQPFAQAAENTARTFGGTGLGLSISKGLADMMGGAIEVRSAAGAGTAMVLTLPLRIADPDDLPPPEPDFAESVQSTEAGGAPRSPPSVQQAERDKTLVLVVDDHPTNRMLMCRQMNVLGYAAEIAANGLEALDKWKSGRFALVVTDCNMPEMDGYELTRLIRRLESVRGPARIPVIACTANALRGEAEKCFAAGMDDYLPKPVQVQQLASKLKQWLPLPEAGERDPGKDGKPAYAEGSADRDPIDRFVLAQTFGSDPATEHEVLRDFLAATEKDMEDLETAVQHDDFKEIRRAAHRIKGASGMVGAVALARHCAAVERSGAARDMGSVKNSLAPLNEEVERIRRSVEAMRREPA